MQKTNNYLVYQCYGNKDILNECIYSILSLLKFGKDTINYNIIIYTDQPDHFAILPADIVTCIPIDQKLIEEYKGPKKFIFRVKIKILEDCCKRFQGKILYADSDIYFLKPIDPLFSFISPDNFLMCENEGRINTGSNLTFKGMMQFIRKNRTYLEGKNILLQPDAVMWNAGMLGFPGTASEILEEVLYVSDSMYELYDSHVTEQLAFSYCLDKAGSVHGCTDYAFHYWNFKEFRKVLSDFFLYHNIHSSLAEIIQDSDSIRPDVLIQPKLEYINLPFFAKGLKRFKKMENRWKMPPYTIGRKI